VVILVHDNSGPQKISSVTSWHEKDEVLKEENMKFPAPKLLFFSFIFYFIFFFWEDLYAFLVTCKQMKKSSSITSTDVSVDG
jgi:hypothetical protein